MARKLDLGKDSPQLQQYRRKTETELLYIVKDASEAALAMKGMDAKAEAKYLDQVNDACTALYERRKLRQKLRTSARTHIGRIAQGAAA